MFLGIFIHLVFYNFGNQFDGHRFIVGKFDGAFAQLVIFKFVFEGDDRIRKGKETVMIGES